MEPSFVLDTGGARCISNDSPIIYCSSRSCYGDAEEDTPVKSIISPRKFRRVATSKRYHENGKFSKIKPGCISSELREALHISHHDIPLHIYRMRSMGYPPGWLRKAKVEQLPFFDGEHEVGSGLEVKYNEDAIIAYPGFNVCSSKLRDEYFTLQCPSIQRRHLLKNFIFSLRNSSTNILEFSRYKESLESKDLNDLKGERQRLLSEINALENSLPLTSNHSELLNKCKELSKTRLDPSESTFLREASGSPRASLADQIFPLNAESASVDDADREGEMRGIATTAEAGFYGEVTQWSAVGESAKEQLELESEEGTAIPSSIAHLVANTSSNSGSGSSPLNISCAQKKLPELEAFSSGIQPFKPYKNLPNAQGAYNRVRNTLKRAKGNPTTLVRSETQNKPTRKLPMSEDPAPRSGLCEGRHGCRPAISMDSRLNSSSGVENRLQRSNKEKIDNQACEMDKLRYRRRHLRQDNLCILESSHRCHPKKPLLQEFDHITYRSPYPACHSAQNERYSYSLREGSICGRYSRSSHSAQGNYFGHYAWHNSYHR